MAKYLQGFFFGVILFKYRIMDEVQKATIRASVRPSVRSLIDPLATCEC